MKIYLAASFHRKLEMREIAKELENAGHEVTSQWIWIDEGSNPALDYWAKRDLSDIRAADCLVLFTQEIGSGYYTGGRHVEFGVALERKQRLILVGSRENIFHGLPEVEQCESWHEAFEHITDGGGKVAKKDCNITA